MEEGHPAVADPGAGLLFDQPQPRRPDLLERRLDVLGGVGHVVQPGAAALEELPHGALGAQRREELDVPVADLEQDGLDAELLDGLAVLLAHLELLAVERHGLVKVLDGHAYVVDSAEHGRGVYSGRSSWSGRRSLAAIRGSPPRGSLPA